MQVSILTGGCVGLRYNGGCLRFDPFGRGVGTGASGCGMARLGKRIKISRMIFISLYQVICLIIGVKFFPRTQKTKLLINHVVFDRRRFKSLKKLIIYFFLLIVSNNVFSKKLSALRNNETYPVPMMEGG